MAISKIVQNSIDETSVSLGAKISNVQIANSSYTVLDDTAVNVGGGYIVITGSGFKESAQVLIGQNTACSVSVVDSTTIRAQVPAKDAGTYPVYVVNTDGGVGIRVPGLTYSGFPTWVTGSTLPTQVVDEAISIQLEATGANTYALQTGSTLPTGMVLNTANGLLTGSVTGVEEETLYNFTIEAIDTENQESPRAFNITITLGDEYFAQTIFLLKATDDYGEGNTHNYIDSSNNNVAVLGLGSGLPKPTRFSPFADDVGRWSVRFNNTSDVDGDAYIRKDEVGDQIGAGSFCIEYWAWTENFNGQNIVHFGFNGVSDGSNYLILNGNILVYNQDSENQSYSSLPAENQWNHFVVERNSAAQTLMVWANGTRIVNASSITNINLSNATFAIGTEADTANFGSLGNYLKGYVSNFRVQNTVVHGNVASITVPTEPYTVTEDTVFLGLNSNQLVDQSNTVTSQTLTGDGLLVNFSPFSQPYNWSASANSASVFLDGNEYIRSDGALDSLTSTSSSWTMEAWVYPMNAAQATGGAINDVVFGVNGAASGENIFGLTTGTYSSLEDNSINDTDLSVKCNRRQWNHIAACYDGSAQTLKIFVNGKLGANRTSITWGSAFSTRVLGIGTEFDAANGGSPGNYFTGYISDVKVSNTAIYSAEFSVPTQPASLDANTQFLSRLGDGARIYDATRKTYVGSVQGQTGPSANTTVTKYDVASVYFDGTDDYLVAYAPNTSKNRALDFQTAPVTIETWINWSSLSGARPICSTRQAGNGGWGFYTDASELKFFSSTTSSVTVTTTSSGITTGTWFHVAFVRNGTSWKIYVNGVEKGSATSSNAINNDGSDNLTIGQVWPSGMTQFQGYMEDLRITKGFARYTSNFTPPSRTFVTRGV